MNNKNIIRMEKRATNKVGIFFVLLLSIIGFGVGGYFVYKNRESIDFTMPWDKDEEEQNPDIPEPSKKEENTSDGKLHLPEISPDVNLLSGEEHASITIHNLKATEKGYEFDVKLTRLTPLYVNPYIAGTVTIKGTKILLDKYEVSPTFNLSVNYTNKEKQAHIIIPMTELQKLDMVSFSALYMFVNIDIEGEQNYKKDRLLYVDAYQDIPISNEKELKDSFVQTDGVKISYYKKIEDNDDTYLYFFVDNKNKEYSHNIELKKFAVNNKSYSKAQINVTSHYNSRTIFFIKVPKKEFKEVETIDLSFILTRPANKKTAIFFTNDKTITIKQNKE